MRKGLLPEVFESESRFFWGLHAPVWWSELTHVPVLRYMPCRAKELVEFYGPNTNPAAVRRRGLAPIRARIRASPQPCRQ